MCCQSSGVPPAAALKKFAPNRRSNESSNSATAITGIAKMIRNEVTSVIQTNTGMRKSVMPGARMLMIVTMKLKPPAIEETPRMSSPNAQKSTPVPGEKCFSVSGA